MTCATGKASGIVDDSRGLAYILPDGSKLLCVDQTTEEILAISFLRWSAEGILPRTFNEAPATLTWLLGRFYASGVRVLAFLKEDEHKTLTPLGLGWINESVVVGTPPVFVKAEVGEAFFRKVSPRDTLWCGRMAIHYCFDRLGLDVIHGMTAERNIPAVRYARKLGFDVCGPIPNSTVWTEKDGSREACGAFISTFTLNMWQNRTWG